MLWKRMSSETLSTPLVTFAGAESGMWFIDRIEALAGEPIGPAKRLHIRARDFAQSPSNWVLRGAVSHARYTTREESLKLNAIQPALGRPEATRAALIPIRKSPTWWALAQDERRAIYEERSRHTTIGLEYLPRIARKLYHSRDLGEPFDFLTWFEFAPEHEVAFNELLTRLRDSEEWRYVDREIDIRVHRVG
jgi:chlorite dismutase